MSMIITCPNCQTRYQVAQNAIGSAGRKVQCANCQQSWQAIPEPDTPPPPPKPRLVEPTEAPSQKSAPQVDASEEQALDEEFEAQAEALGSPPEELASAEEFEAIGENSELDTGLNEKRNRAMRARQKRFARKLPMGRVRRFARFASFTLLALIIVGGLFLRTEIVRFFPDMAGVYEAVGLGVNVVGLEFDNIETLRAQQDGQDVTLITGRIRNVSGGQVRVPAIIVSICDSNGEVVYSWSVAAPAQLMNPGESVEFETQLNSAPNEAEMIELTFADGRAR